MTNTKVFKYKPSIRAEGATVNEGGTSGHKIQWGTHGELEVLQKTREAVSLVYGGCSCVSSTKRWEKKTRRIRTEFVDETKKRKG